MTRGKKTCKILKEIRTQIAEKNDIEYVTSECGFQGECKGTCPKCEEEVRYLENELRKRQQLGKVVTIAGISLGVAGTFAACGNSAQQSDEKNSQVEDTVKVAQYSATSLNFDSLQPAPPPDLVTTSTYTTVGYVVPEDGIMSLSGNAITGGLVFDQTFNLTERGPAVLNGRTPISEPLEMGKMPVLIDSVELPEDIVPVPSVIDDEAPGMILRDTKAEFPGGMQALMRFINENLQYPQEAFDAGFQGMIIVEFVVQADGTIDSVKVLKKLHPILEQEAIRVVKSMPKWKPGERDGEAVSSYFQLPIRFKPEKSKSEEN